MIDSVTRQRRKRSCPSLAEMKSCPNKLLGQGLCLTLRKFRVLLVLVSLGLCLTTFVYIGLIQKVTRSELAEVLGVSCACTEPFLRHVRGDNSALQAIDLLLSHNWTTALKQLSSSHKGNLSQGEILQRMEQKINEAKVEYERQQRGEEGEEDSEFSPLALQSRKMASLDSVHEKARRRVESTSRTVVTYLLASLQDLKRRATGNISLQNVVDGVHYTLMGMQDTLAADLHYLRKGEGDEEWRKAESKRLGKLVQKRLDYLQNPTDCAHARFVVCNLKQACGFGCLLHHACYCLLVAYATNRTFVLQEGSLLYAEHKWESVFRPLSWTCKSATEPIVRWGANGTDWENARSLLLPLISQMNQRPRFLPMAIPEDLAPRLSVFHGDPPVWWLGQLLRYLTRPNKNLLDHKSETAKRLGFIKPIVGVHIRRTDKLLKEASYYPLEEYMRHVEQYFREREHRWPVGQRRVYLATDDPNLLDEARKKYPKYEFVSDNQVSKMASTESRFTNASLLGITMDIHFLSKSDFIVCTFSSNVCRAAYALMQTNDGDASTNVISLDKRFYFNGQRDERMWTIEKHDAWNKNQLSFETGDLLHVIGNDLSGMMARAQNMRTGKEGMFPIFKAVKEIVSVKMPTYPDVTEPKD